MFFDASVDPAVTTKTPPAGGDILQASANNLYAGVTMKDLEGFEERYPLNSRLVKKNGKLVEEVYRVGGRYDPQIRAVVGHLEAAMPFATAPMAQGARRAVRGTAPAKSAIAARTTSPGSPTNHRQSIRSTGSRRSISMRAASRARGRRSSTTSTRRRPQPSRSSPPRRNGSRTICRGIRSTARTNVQGITANVIDVVIETGDAGPITPIGINLPNEQEVREQYGSKSVSISNVNEAYDKSMDAGFRSEFSWSPEEAARAREVAGLRARAHHRSARGDRPCIRKVHAKLGCSPQTVLKEQYSAIEESRADLVALYFLPDAKMVEMGLIEAADHEDVVRAEYENYARIALVQLRRIREGTTIEEDHMRNRQMIVHWLMANTKAIEKRARDGKTYYVMVDAKAFRDGVARLLAEVQRIKADGTTLRQRRCSRPTASTLTRSCATKSSLASIG